MDRSLPRCRATVGDPFRMPLEGSIRLASTAGSIVKQAGFCRGGNSLYDIRILPTWFGIGTVMKAWRYPRSSSFIPSSPRSNGSMATSKKRGARSAVNGLGQTSMPFVASKRKWSLSRENGRRAGRPRRGSRKTPGAGRGSCRRGARSPVWPFRPSGSEPAPASYPPIPPCSSRLETAWCPHPRSGRPSGHCRSKPGRSCFPTGPAGRPRRFASSSGDSPSGKKVHARAGQAASATS